MNTLEEDLEEEQLNNETVQEKARKALMQADNLTTEVSQLQSNLLKSESLKSQLDKQVRGDDEQLVCVATLCLCATIHVCVPLCMCAVCLHVCATMHVFVCVCVCGWTEGGKKWVITMVLSPSR